MLLRITNKNGNKSSQYYFYDLNYRNTVFEQKFVKMKKKILEQTH